jgi:hypothetical protein
VIAIIAAILASAVPWPAPSGGYEGPDDCATAVMIRWGQRVDRVRGRRGTDAELRALSHACEDAGHRVGIDPDFLRAIAWVESKGRPASRSKVGARGPFQILPMTARPVLPPEVTRRELLRTLHSSDRSAIVAARVLRRMADKFGARALTAYTCGVTARCRKDGRLFTTTRVSRAYFRTWRKLRREASTYRSSEHAGTD